MVPHPGLRLTQAPIHNMFNGIMTNLKIIIVTAMCSSKSCGTFKAEIVETTISFRKLSGIVRPFPFKIVGYPLWNVLSSWLFNFGNGNENGNEKLFPLSLL